MNDAHSLLAPDEPAPVAEFNPHGAAPFLLICDHFGRLIPKSLGDLGLPPSERARHIAYDIGIAGVATALAQALDAHLVAQRYSRLVIDCNRPLDAASSIPTVSETTTIPGNAGLSPAAAGARRDRIFAPYHARIAAVLDARRRARRPTALVALHSFTPVYAGVARPWHVGALYQHDRTLAPLLLGLLRGESGLVVGDNEPYAVSAATDYSIPVHGERRGLANTGIEIRQDLIANAEGQHAWAARLARIFRQIEVRLLSEGALAG